MASNKENKSILITILKFVIIILIISVAVLGIAIGVSTVKNNSKNSNTPSEENVKRNVVVINENISNDNIDKNISAASSHDVKMNSTWTFPSGDAVSTDAYVENPISNANAVYFDVVLNNNNRIYTSPILPVGSYLKNIALDKKLSSGSSDAVLTYYLLDSDNTTTIGTLKMNVKIIIEN